MFITEYILPFLLLNTEGRPDRTGLRLSNELAMLDVPVKLLIDSAVAYTMDEVDMVFVGADGVVESGGIINMMGTYQIALVAHSMNKPIYVAAESYKVKKASFLFLFLEESELGIYPICNVPKKEYKLRLLASSILT